MFDAFGLSFITSFFIELKNIIASIINYLSNTKFYSFVFSIFKSTEDIKAREEIKPSIRRMYERQVPSDYSWEKEYERRNALARWLNNEEEKEKEKSKNPELSKDIYTEKIDDTFKDPNVVVKSSILPVAKPEPVNNSLISKISKKLDQIRSVIDTDDDNTPEASGDDDNNKTPKLDKGKGKEVPEITVTSDNNPFATTTFVNVWKDVQSPMVSTPTVGNIGLNPKLSPLNELKNLDNFDAVVDKKDDDNKDNITLKEKSFWDKDNGNTTQKLDKGKGKANPHIVVTSEDNPS